MIKIIEKTNGIVIEFNKKYLGFSRENWELFKDNLIIDFNEEQWVKDIKVQIPYSEKITPNELTPYMFNCLYYEHEANYKDKTIKKLNVKRLLSICNWEKL